MIIHEQVVPFADNNRTVRVVLHDGRTAVGILERGDEPPMFVVGDLTFEAADLKEFRV